MGKTELVHHCFENKEVARNFICIDFDILQTSSMDQFVLLFGEAVYKQMAKRSDKLLKLFFSTIKSLSAGLKYDPVSAFPSLEVKIGDIHYPEYTLGENFQLP